MSVDSSVKEVNSVLPCLMRYTHQRHTLVHMCMNLLAYKYKCSQISSPPAPQFQKVRLKLPLVRNNRV